jgi:saccharopine dehydrogenase (NAD+, L-lysine-forming)
VIGIRREDKNRWERRVPLTPDHVAELTRRGVPVAVQPSEVRVFPDDAYRRAGARLSENLAESDVVIGVKEVPLGKLTPGTTYAFFSHVIKGQPANMPMLRRLMDLGGTLVDYERIVDDRGRRLIFFGRHAGFAGMLDTLWALGRRLAHERIDSPFAPIRMAHEYADLEDAHQALSRVGDEIRRDGLPPALHPAVFGFTGSGNASRGAQEIFDLLPHEVVCPERLEDLFTNPDTPRNLLHKVVFGRGDRIRRKDGAPFDAAAFSPGDGLRESAMARHLTRLTVLVNGVYWTPGHPPVVGPDDLAAMWSEPDPPRLRVIGDISCDLPGSIAATVKITTPGDPVYVYEVATGRAVPGVSGHGPVVLAIDNLPCQLPVDASQHFGDALSRFVPAIARCDWTAPFASLRIPDEIRRAVIVHRGALTPAYAYLGAYLAERAGRLA